MKEKNLLKVALICSLVGIVALYFISENIDDIDKNVKVKGFVKDLFENEKVMIITIEQPQDMTIVLFKSKNESVGINKGSNIEVIGKVDEYEGELEIIGNKVRVIG